MKTEKRKTLAAKPRPQGRRITYVLEDRLRKTIKRAIEHGVRKLYVDEDLGFLEKRSREVRTALFADLSKVCAEYGKARPSEWREAERDYAIRQAIYEFLEGIDAQTNPFWDDYRNDDGLIFLYQRIEEN